MDTQLLRGHTALVTGAFSGLGLHFSGVLAGHGARVAMVGRRLQVGQEAAARIVESFGADTARAYRMDVTEPDSVAQALAAVCREWGAPHIVVNNAGTVARAPSLQVTAEDWDGVVDVNLSGVFRVAQACAQAMIDAGRRGSIINIASILGLRVRTQVASYAATKAAVIQLTKALALEWAPHGIRVNALAPGYFETAINRDFLHSDAGRALIARVPAQRVGQLHELDGPLLLLASDASSYMSGTVIAVDGGHLVNTL